MSYPQEIEEIPDDKIFAEYERRLDARANGNCTYCSKPTTDEPCKFPERHNPRSSLKDTLNGNR